MTAIRLVCEPSTGNPKVPSLDLAWNEDAGTISGAGVEWIRELISEGWVKCHPGPGWFHKLSTNPLRSRTDMAALIGCAHRIPAALVDAYPQGTENEEIIVHLLDERGNVIGLDQVLL